MTFDPIKFLDIATKLLYDTKFDEETRYRTCTSRAYYAAHLFTREKLKGIEITIKIEKDEKIGIIHDKVIHALAGKNKKLGEMLFDLRERRGDADYDLNKKFSGYGYAVGLDISNAEFIINEVDKLKK